MNSVVPVLTSPSDIRQRNSITSCRSISYLTTQMVSMLLSVGTTCRIIVSVALSCTCHCSGVMVIRVFVVKRPDRVYRLDVMVT